MCIGNIFSGSTGYLAIDGNYRQFRTYMGKEQAPGPGTTATFGNTFSNFIDAVRSRRHESLTAEIEEGAISTTLVHLANISYRLGRTLHFDAATYSCQGDEEANRMFSRSEYRAPFIVPKLV